MSTPRRYLAGALLGAVLAAVPAGAASAAVTMTSAPSPSISWTLAPTGANTKTAGTLTVQANEAYTVRVVADKTRLTEWVTANSAYETSQPKTIAAPLTLLTSLQSGLGVPVASVAVGTGAVTIATGVGTVIAPATDTYALTLSQGTAITDPALPSGRTYHIVLTYTASATI